MINLNFNSKIIKILLVLSLGFSLLALYLNFNIATRKFKESVDTFSFADSIEGISFKYGDGKVDSGEIIFIFSSKLCETCFLIAFEKLVNGYADLIHKAGVIVINDKKDDSLIGILGFKGYMDFLKLSHDSAFVHSFLPNWVSGVVMFIDRGKIIFAEELKFDNLNRIDFFYKKLTNYLKKP